MGLGSSVLVGIFVGGASRRMGTPKGLLPAPDAPHLTLVERLMKEIQVATPGAPIFLVGERAEYEHLGLPALADEVSDSGPLGGLVALLAHAQKQGMSHALALACDHPYLRASLMSRLLSEAPSAPIVCPYASERYQPLIARYRVDVLDDLRVALEARRLSLQPLLRAAPAVVLELEPDQERALVDWDTPEEIDSP